MRSSTVLLIVFLVVWIAGSLTWYACHFQGKCLFQSEPLSTSGTLMVQLGDREEEIFRLHQSGDGMLQFESSEDGGIGRIRDYMSMHPEMDLDLVAANEGQVNGLLALLVLGGVPNYRIRTYTDPSLGTKDRPMVLRTVSNQWAEPSEFDADTTETADTLLTLAGNPENPEVADVTEAPAYPPALPCPGLTVEAELPQLSAIYYPMSGYKARCTSALQQFSKQAMEVFDTSPDLILQIIGHTDGIQQQTNNYQLALRRAVEIKKYLIIQGLPGARIETYSRGGDDPVADNDTAEGRQQNRRVELRWKEQK